MKRFGRFIKWCFSGMGWFEWSMLSISFCGGAGITSIIIGNEQLKNFWLTATIVITAVSMTVFVSKGILYAWNKFKEDDEKVFNILKKDEIK